MTVELFLRVLFSAVEQGTPLFFAALGGIISERSGILNLGIEGILALTAFSAFIFLHFFGSPWLALLFASGVGALFTCVHGLICIVFRGNQVVSGLALTILGVGLADFLGTPYIGVATKGFAPIAVPYLSDIPILGPILFVHTAPVYFSYLVLAIASLFLFKTKWGLALCASGENPNAVMAGGVSPYRWRWIGLMLSGMCIGLGGAYLSLAATHEWTHSMVAGRGWIAIALVIFAFWHPTRALLGAYLFCGVSAFQLRLQSAGILHIPTWFLTMFPYVLTLLALLFSSFFGKGRAAPKALGQNLEPGE